MLKFLLLIIIVVYVIVKLSRFLALLSITRRQGAQREDAHPPKGETHHRDSGRRRTIKGGEYVDFEEVK